MSAAMTIDEDTKTRVRRRAVHYILESVVRETGCSIHDLTQLAHGGWPALTERQWFLLARRMHLV